MSTTQRPKDASIDAQPGNLDKRSIKALLNPMTVIDNAGDVADEPGRYEVTTEREYTVDLNDNSCTCPDKEYNLAHDEDCKHLKRVKYETGQLEIPAWVTLAALDDQLGMHIDETPRIAMTDGGVATLEASTDAPADTDPRDDYIHIGVDCEGGAHCYRTTDETVFAIEGGEITQRYDVSNRSVNDWIAYVDDRRGWESQELYQTMGDAVMGAL